MHQKLFVLFNTISIEFVNIVFSKFTENFKKELTNQLSHNMLLQRLFFNMPMRGMPCNLSILDV